MSNQSTHPTSFPLIFERAYPLGIGAVVAAGYLLCPISGQYRLNESFDAVLGAVVGLAGIAAGFLATAKSIIIALDDRPIIRKLKKTPYYRMIVADLRSAVLYSCLLAAYSTAGLVVDLKEPFTFLREVLFASWLWLCVTTVLAYWRTMRVYNAILTVEDF
jgi:hypothetical protein